MYENLIGPFLYSTVTRRYKVSCCNAKNISMEIALVKYAFKKTGKHIF